MSSTVNHGTVLLLAMHVDDHLVPHTLGRLSSVATPTPHIHDDTTLTAINTATTTTDAEMPSAGRERDDVTPSSSWFRAGVYARERSTSVRERNLRPSGEK